MSFVKQGFEFITNIYDTYFESNAKTSNVNTKDLKLNTDHIPQNITSNAISQTHYYNTRSKAKSTNKYKFKYNDDYDDDNYNHQNRKNMKNQNLKSVPNVLVIDTSTVSVSYDSCSSCTDQDDININMDRFSCGGMGWTCSSPSCSSTKSNASSQEERIHHLESTIKGLEMSLNNSKTAKGGYIEEEKVVQDLNAVTGLSIHFMKMFLPHLYQEYKYTDSRRDKVPISYSQFKRHPNSFCKTDVVNNDHNINIQIKRYDVKCCYGQIDRHWLDDFIRVIPDLKSVSFMLRNLSEIPLIAGTNIVDKEVGRITLSLDNYSEKQLYSLISRLNRNIVPILTYVLQGINSDNSPNYLMGIEYNKDTRVKTVIYKMSDVIDALSQKFTFHIKARSTVITLGDIISLQRKGGDNGLRSSNQLQWKLRFASLSAIIPSSKRLEYFF